MNSLLRYVVYSSSARYISTFWPSTLLPFSGFSFFFWKLNFSFWFSTVKGASHWVEKGQSNGHSVVNSIPGSSAHISGWLFVQAKDHHKFLPLVTQIFILFFKKGYSYLQKKKENLNFVLSLMMTRFRHHFLIVFRLVFYCH